MELTRYPICFRLLWSWQQTCCNSHISEALGTQLLRTTAYPMQHSLSAAACCCTQVLPRATSEELQQLVQGLLLLDAQVPVTDDCSMPLATGVVAVHLHDCGLRSPGCGYKFAIAALCKRVLLFGLRHMRMLLFARLQVRQQVATAMDAAVQPEGQLMHLLLPPPPPSAVAAAVVLLALPV